MSIESHYLKNELYNKIKEDQNIFDFLQNGSLDGIWYWDLEKPENEWMSPIFWTTFGYDPKNKKHLASEWQDLIHPDDLQLALENFKKHCADPNHPYDQVVRYYHKDGSTVWIRCRGIAIRDKTGKPIRMLGAHTDLTSLKKVEEALRESERKMKSIFQAAPIGIGVVSNRVIQDVNRRFCEISGYSRDELIGQNARIVYPTDEDYEYVGSAKYSMIEEKGTGAVETRFKRKDGEIINVLVSSTPLDPKDLSVGVTFTALDITDRKRAETALRESEERYRGLIRNITDFIYSHDLEGRFITVNRAASRTLGYSPENLIGRPISDFMLPEYRQAFKEDYLAHIKQKGSFGGVTIYVAKDGSKHYIEYRNVLVKQEGMEPFVTGSGRDITEKILSEREVQKLREQVHRSQKMEALGLMAGGVAHDLNNILSGIVSYPELLLMDLPEDSPLKKPIETIKESGMKAADVVADLLTIARGVATGKDVLNLNTIVTEYFGSAEYQRLEKMHSFVDFKTEADPDLLNMSGSPSHIKKTLMNLVLNASEAIEGSGTVTISTTNRYLDEPLKGYEDVRIGEYAVLTVSDDGSGISAEDLERIFEPFYTKKVMERSGTGLGLAVVWNTVQDHNGYIDVKSSEEGTIFELYFPVTRDEVTAEKEEVPLEDYLGHGEKVLVVDDEERQREIACQMLAKLGYTADAVSSGEEAIEYVKKHSAELILLDMVMPKGINGRKTYEEIIKIRPGQKAIIASGYAKTKEMDIAQDLGAGKYIKKPYTLEKIGLAVKEELEK